MNNVELKGLEYMGENVKSLLKVCGDGARINPLAKICKPEVVELGANCRIGDFAFIFGGQGVKIGEYTDFQPHTTIWGGVNA